VNRFLYLGVVLIVGTASAGLFAQPDRAGDSRRQTALALEQVGRNSEAEAAWRVYLKSHPSSPEPYAHLGILASRQEHYKEAVQLYRKALALNSNVQGLRLNLGLALFKGGDLKGAIPEFSLVLKNTPSESPDAQRLTILIGMSHYGLAQYAAAVPFLTRAAAQDRQNLPIRLALAHSCLWSKQTQCALDVYHEILTLNSESAEADVIAGEALNEMKDNEGSTRMFRAAILANPREPNAHFALGYLLWMQKIYPEAAKEFQAELANDPGHVQSMLYLGDTKIQLNDQPAAQPILEKVARLDPALSLVHLDLGIIYLDEGRNDDALRELRLAEKLTPDDVSVHWRLARLYRTMGKKDEAKAEFDKASTINKAVDDDLFKKIANGRAKGPQDNQAPVAAPNP
jgi:tetratricopeptide (TPR) repeat protein